MTNYIVYKNLRSQLTEDPYIVDLRVFGSLPEAKEYYDEIKFDKKNVFYIFTNQIVKTELIIYDGGIPKLNETYDRKEAKIEILEKEEWQWFDDLSDKIKPNKKGKKKRK